MAWGLGPYPMFSPHRVQPGGISDPRPTLWTRVPSASRWSLQPAAMLVSVGSEVSAGRPRLVRSALTNVSDCVASVASLADARSGSSWAVSPAPGEYQRHGDDHGQRQRSLHGTSSEPAIDRNSCCGSAINPPPDAADPQDSTAGRSASSDPEDARSGLGQFGGEDPLFSRWSPRSRGSPRKTFGQPTSAPDLGQRDWLPAARYFGARFSGVCGDRWASPVGSPGRTGANPARITMRHMPPGRVYSRHAGTAPGRSGRGGAARKARSTL